MILIIILNLLMIGCTSVSDNNETNSEVDSNTEEQNGTSTDATSEKEVTLTVNDVIGAFENEGMEIDFVRSDKSKEPGLIGEYTAYYKLDGDDLMVHVFDNEKDVSKGLKEFPNEYSNRKTELESVKLIYKNVLLVYFPKEDNINLKSVFPKGTIK